MAPSNARIALSQGQVPIQDRRPLQQESRSIKRPHPTTSLSEGSLDLLAMMQAAHRTHDDVFGQAAKRRRMKTQKEITERREAEKQNNKENQDTAKSQSRLPCSKPDPKQPHQPPNTTKREEILPDLVEESPSVQDWTLLAHRDVDCTLPQCRGCAKAMAKRVRSVLGNQWTKDVTFRDGSDLLPDLQRLLFQVPGYSN